MTDCRWNGRHEPRVLPGRHLPECPQEAAGADLTASECPGCLPCPARHCTVCQRVHSDGACPECLAATRDDLAAIRLMCGALPTEVEHRGVNGEAMMLLGASADPEAWQHVQASYLAGRLPEGWFEASHRRDCPTLRNEPCVGCAGDELHPLTVLGTWEMVWRDFLEHESDAKVTVEESAAYLDRNLAYMAGQDDVPFDDFARDVRRCRGHLEDVLHDGEQRDTGAPCMTCGVALERTWGKDDKGDGWACPRCRQTSTEEQYRFAVMHLHRAEAEWLTDRDMEIRTGVKAGTVRSWARDRQDGTAPDVRKRRDSGRTLYAVADVLVTARDKGLVA